MQPAVSPPEPTLRWEAWLSSDYGCKKQVEAPARKGTGSSFPVHPLILVAIKHLLNSRKRDMVAKA